MAALNAREHPRRRRTACIRVMAQNDMHQRAAMAARNRAAAAFQFLDRRLSPTVRGQQEHPALFIFVNQFKDGAQFKDNAFEPRYAWY
jgi:hypothetical protein